MKWTIRRAKYERGGHFWEAKRPDGMWISRRSHASLMAVLAKAAEFETKQARLQAWHGSVEPSIEQLSGGS